MKDLARTEEKLVGDGTYVTHLFLGDVYLTMGPKTYVESMSVAINSAIEKARAEAFEEAERIALEEADIQAESMDNIEYAEAMVASPKYVVARKIAAAIRSRIPATGKGG